MVYIITVYFTLNLHLVSSYLMQLLHTIQGRASLDTDSTPGFLSFPRTKISTSVIFWVLHLVSKIHTRGFTAEVLIVDANRINSFSKSIPHERSHLCRFSCISIPIPLFYFHIFHFSFRTTDQFQSSMMQIIIRGRDSCFYHRY